MTAHNNEKIETTDADLGLDDEVDYDTLLWMDKSTGIGVDDKTDTRGNPVRPVYDRDSGEYCWM